MAYRENAKILKADCLADGVYEIWFETKDIAGLPLRLDSLYQYILMMVQECYQDLSVYVRLRIII